MGVVGLSLGDTLLLTTEEFGTVYEEWTTLETARYRAGWEQARFIGYSNLIPYSKKGFTPPDMIRFDWEKEEVGAIDVCNKDDFRRMCKMFED